MTFVGERLDRGGLVMLDAETSLALAATVPLGRLAYRDGDLMEVLPVAHRVQGGQVAVRTAPGHLPATAIPGRAGPVAFQTDAYDERARTGWSVLVHGVAQPASSTSRWLRLLGEDGESQGALLVIRPTRVTGRRIRRADASDPTDTPPPLRAPLPAVHERPIRDATESRHRLRAAPVGRLVVALHDRPLVLPVNHTVEGWDVVFRTAPGSKLDVAQTRAGAEAAFEANAYDPATGRGWMVLATGRLHPVLDQIQAARLDGLDLDVWADAVQRRRWVRLVVERIRSREVYLTPPATAPGPRSGAR